MQQFDLSLMPTAVDVTLYRYNYIDNKLWAQILDETDYIKGPDGSILITMSQLEYIIGRHYTPSINKIKTLGSEVIHKEINSVYFLYQMTMEMTNIQYFKFNLNLDKSYNRTVTTGDTVLLQFGFKILTATLRLDELYNSEELPIINNVLEKIGILQPGIPYNRITSKNITDKLDKLLENPEIINEYTDGEYAMVSDIIDVLEPKLEPENSLILLITDY